MNYRGLESSKPTAKKSIPKADTPVKARRTRGRARNTDALSTALISDEYQADETDAWTQAKMNMPQPNENDFGTNCGMKATAKTAAFTLVRLVSKPNRNAGKKFTFAVPVTSNFPDSFRNSKRV